MNVEKLIAAAREIEQRYNKLQSRTKFLQDLASEARRTGRSMSHRLDEAPQVVDFGGPIADLVKALHARPSKKRP